MSKGFTLIEMVLTVILLSILSAFTFSVIWQYSRLYADTKGGYIYGEAAAVMERMSRELTDAANIDKTIFPSNGAISTTYISFQPQNKTPADTAAVPSVWPPNYWVQYCTCTTWDGRRWLYRILNPPDPSANYCSSCPPPTGRDYAPFAQPMSSSIKPQGFAVQYNQACPTSNPRYPQCLSDNDSYTITLGLTSNRAVPDNPSITLVTRVTPRNYAPYQPGSGTGMGSERSFNGGYFDEVN